MSVVISTAFNAKNIFADSTGSKIEFWGGLVYNFGHYVADGPLRVAVAYFESSVKNFLKHFYLVGSHSGEGFAGEHGRNHNGGPFLGDPESFGGGIGDHSEYARKENIG